MGHNKELIRLDKAIAAQTSYSRKEVHKLTAAGKILINGQPERSFDRKVDLSSDLIAVDGQQLFLSQYSYLMLYKPKGVVCATADQSLPTVLDLVPPELMRAGLFPAGRLDKDTEGFVLITNDGELAHRILAPKSHLPKTYLARLDKPFDDAVEEAFATGVMLPPESTREQRVQSVRAAHQSSAVNEGDLGRTPIRCMPVQLAAVNGDRTLARVVLRQGLYHQIKRMFAAHGLSVVELFREKIGALALDPSLKPGECRPVSEGELQLMCADSSVTAL